MDQINGITTRIQEAADGGNVDKVISESENKQRAINNLAQIQTKIEAILASWTAPFTQEVLSVLRCWADDFSNMTERWNQQDAVTAVILEGAREQTTREIAAVFKSKERHKGYSLANVKK